MIKRQALAGFVLCAACTTAWSQTEPFEPPQPPPQPHIELSDSRFDFGEPWQGAAIEKVFTVRNTGRAPLSLSLRTTCGCTVATEPKSPLEPGEADEFKVTYDSLIPGKASKKVILTTNDPQRPRIEIPVAGEVRPIFKTEASSQFFRGNRIIFVGMTLHERHTETLKLTNNYTRPVKLDLVAAHHGGVYDVDLHTLEPGQAYRLDVTTRPPLKHGMNFTKVRLETDIEFLPELTYGVYAKAQPAVQVMPKEVWIRAGEAESAERLVRVRCARGQDVSVTNVTSGFGKVGWQSQRERLASPTALHHDYQLRLKLPGYAELPAEGGTVTIHTDHADDRFKQLVLSVKRKSE